MVKPLKQANWEVQPPSKLELKEFSDKQYYHTEPRECLLCNMKFDHFQSKTKYCRCCKIFINCPGCNKKFELIGKNYSGSAWNSILGAIEKGEEIKIYCTKSCSNINRRDFGTCPNCKHENVDIYNSRCAYCANKELNAPITCEIHGYQPYSFGGLCITCHNQTDEMREQARLQGFKNINLLSDENLEIYLEILAKEGKSNKKDIFDKDKIDIKDVSTKIKIEKINRAKIKKQTKLEKSLILKEKRLKNRTCQKHNLVFTFLDKSQVKRVCWECHKEKFKLCNNDFMNVEIPKLGGFFQPTFRVKEGSSIGQNGMELELVEKGVGNFVYIKFYNDENGKIKPLVAGLSGSLLVNKNGTDVSFSTNPTHGPARRYLLEHNLKWFEKFIYVIPVSSREESEKLEKQIIKEYKLFGS